LLLPIVRMINSQLWHVTMQNGRVCGSWEEVTMSWPSVVSCVSAHLSCTSSICHQKTMSWVAAVPE
jgi:hypothetical protein